MFDFKALSAFRTQTEKLSEKRREKSGDSCKRGFLCLLNAEKQDFRNKELLEQACDCFAEAISQDRLSPEPYFGMGYLLFLLQDYPMAINYLHESAKLNPANPDVALLLEHIENQSQISQKQKTVVPVPFRPSFTLPTTGSDVDYDHLYDEVENLIHQEVRKMVSGMLRPPLPSINESEIQQLQQSKEQQLLLLQDIQSQLKMIDAEIDTSELLIKLKPIETMVKRLEQAWRASQEMVAIQQGITGLQERLPSFQHQIEHAQKPEDLVEFEHLQEIIMDMCDQIADCLDELEQKKYPIQPLVQMYEQFVGAVEILNDLYDDILAKVSDPY